MKILLAIDDSPHSRSAVESMRQRPWPQETVVRIMSVVQPIPPFATELWYAPSVDVTAWDAEMDKRANALVTRVAATLQPSGLATEEIVRTGDPRMTIVNEASEWRADLIVLGSHGYTGIQRLLLGSVAQYVVSHADCSVEVIRERRA